MATASDALNFITPEAAIVQRLTAALMTGSDACVRAVLTAPEMADVQESGQTVPAVYVVYRGWAVEGADPQLRVTYRHRWVVTVAVGSKARMKESFDRHSEAGPIVRRVTAALHGWAPAVGFSRLAPITPPAPAYSPGYAYFPLAFSTTATGVADAAR